MNYDINKILPLILLLISCTQTEFLQNFSPTYSNPYSHHTNNQDRFTILKFKLNKQNVHSYLSNYTSHNDTVKFDHLYLNQTNKLFRKVARLIQNDTLPGNLTEDEDNENGSDGHNEKNLQLIVTWIIGVLYTITLCVGLIGNLLVVLTIALNKQMRSSTNILILNLAIADLIFICICVPFTGLNYVLSVWYFGDFLCKLVQYTSNVTAYASVYILVLMSIDRYLAISYPLTSKLYRTQKNTVVSVVILWTVILAANIPHLFLWENYQYTFESTNRSVCILKYHVERSYAIQSNNFDLLAFVEHKTRLYYLIFFLFAYLLPLILLFILYCLILYKLSLNKGKQVGKSKSKVTRMVIAVVSCFVICWSPLQIMLCLQHVVGLRFDTVQVVVLVLSNGIGYFNSCLNPIIYGFSNKEFEKAYSNILRCKNWRKSGQYDNSLRTITVKRLDSVNGGFDTINPTTRNYNYNSNNISSAVVVFESIPTAPSTSTRQNLLEYTESKIS